MTDFLLELRSEEIPARMQDKARADLARLFAAEMEKAGLPATGIETFATPRRLALIARDLPSFTAAVSEETKGPRTSAPEQALDGFLRKTGLTRADLTERDGVWFAIVNKPGRATADVIAEAIPAIVRAFPWPKSMRWGTASASSSSLRWVRPLQGIVALLGETVVPFEIEGVASGAVTLGHRFHHPGEITIGSAADYADKLRLCHVIVDPAERATIIEEGAAALAAANGLSVIPDPGLVAENAGLTEWPVPLLGFFDPAFLEVPREVIQLTLRTNQKYFVLNDEGGNLAPAFLCTANIDAVDGGVQIVAGNGKVLAARLSDARFFWEQDLKVRLEDQAKKLGQIVFHEKLGTVADKVERVAKLARWLVEEGIVGGNAPQTPFVLSEVEGRAPNETPAPEARASTSLSTNGDRVALADMAEQAARLCKADLVTGMVGEFPELQGIMGGYYARAEGLPDAVADAIRDHYKPVGQGDDVPTAPVTVAVSLADKLDSILAFFLIQERPTGSKDPFALRRSALGIIGLSGTSGIKLPLNELFAVWTDEVDFMVRTIMSTHGRQVMAQQRAREQVEAVASGMETETVGEWVLPQPVSVSVDLPENTEVQDRLDMATGLYGRLEDFDPSDVLSFLIDRLKVQQREAGVRHDLIDAVFALGGEDDLVRLLARVKALQAFVETDDGRNLIAGYKRAANILRKEGWEEANTSRHPGLEPGSRLSADSEEEAGSRLGGRDDEVGVTALSYTPEKAEADLLAALATAEAHAASAVVAEEYETAMSALATLRAPIDAFFEAVIVNDADPEKRAARLGLLARMRGACHTVADFSRIEG
ncbi:glycine--tRNA ligase subunit beta [Sphingomonas sp. AP4-R1]|uniref:glycine--tRNA ligase subunit beta n=1 Tax=Sphingomonas sp. AP4-R1 TaxID=2735134 RepID=UPI0014937D0C|nr:glycine--tRNA ligase subunit beta [Sphingomonas sp. AP4-R1]QJU59517.1 glycine--tRNA ligase subunit beta [Sphingomonas sp. AP4-R1]